MKVLKETPGFRWGEREVVDTIVCLYTHCNCLVICLPDGSSISSIRMSHLFPTNCLRRQKVTDLISHRHETNGLCQKKQGSNWLLQASFSTTDNGICQHSKLRQVRTSVHSIATCTQPGQQVHLDSCMLYTEVRFDLTTSVHTPTWETTHRRICFALELRSIVASINWSTVLFHQIEKVHDCNS